MEEQGGSLKDPPNLLCVFITFQFAIETAAVLLAIEIQRFGDVAAVRIAFSKVSVEEFDAIIPSDFFAYFL